MSEVPATQEVDDGSMPFALLFYGMVSWLLVTGPITCYLLFTDDMGYAKYHQTWIQMAGTAYFSLAIVFAMALFEDTTSTRRALAGSVEMAGLGPFGLLWVGLWSFMMYSSNAGVLDEKENEPWAGIYAVLNILLLIMHWNFAPQIYEWTKKTPPAQAKQEDVEDVAEADPVVDEVPVVDDSEADENLDSDNAAQW